MARNNNEGALVKNASSVSQTQNAARLEAEREARFAKNLAAVLSTEAGQEVLWAVLGRTKILESIYVQSAEIYYNAGRQDVGHWLLEQLEKADPRALLTLMERQHTLTTIERKTNHAG